MAEKKSNRLAHLVRSATDDLAAETPLRRGRGLDGLIADASSPDDKPTSQQEVLSASQQEVLSASRKNDKLASIQVDKSAIVQADTSTSTQVDTSTSTQADKPTRTLGQAEGARRVVRSYRIDDELAHRLDLVAARERRKIYEVVEAAFARYLEERGG